MKLLIRGGSIAAGYGVTKGYADILKETISANGIEVINRSRHRDTSFEGIGTFNEDIAPFAPDILLLHFGVDDAFDYVYRSEFQENIVQMIRRARALFNPLIFLATAHILDNPHDMAAVEIFYRSLRIVAVDLNCTSISLDRYWAGYLAKNCLTSDDLVLSDSRYPNEKGHEVFAQAIIKSLYRALPALA
ncbi:MAG TPA: SGNH/GDSL hydrolase family protein [Deltaproteobacteria bacterium]|nr:SGNH/GDSL hydrolase family protein [Deltaproteobacteria bacterium]